MQKLTEACDADVSILCKGKPELLQRIHATKSGALFIYDLQKVGGMPTPEGLGFCRKTSTRDLLFRTRSASQDGKSVWKASVLVDPNFWR